MEAIKYFLDLCMSLNIKVFYITEIMIYHFNLFIKFFQYKKNSTKIKAENIIIHSQNYILHFCNLINSL